MNLTEDLGNVTNSSEDFSGLQNPSQQSSGFGRGKKYPGAEVPDPGNERGDHMIMEEAYAMFENQGERRSMRMIGEYCKTGELVCFYDSDDKRWHITRESIENKINKIKDLNARRAAVAPQSTSEHFSEPAAAPQRPAEEVQPQHEADPSPFALIKKLRTRIFNLRILNQGKDYLIEKLQEERGELLTRIETSNRASSVSSKPSSSSLKGQKVKRQPPGTPFDHAVPYRDVDEVSSSHPIDPNPTMSPNEPLADNVNTYEHPPQP